MYGILLDSIHLQTNQVYGILLDSIMGNGEKKYLKEEKNFFFSILILFTTKTQFPFLIFENLILGLT